MFNSSNKDYPESVVHESSVIVSTQALASFMQPRLSLTEDSEITELG